MHPPEFLYIKMRQRAIYFSFYLEKIGCNLFLFAQFALVFFPIGSLKKISIREWADCVPKNNYGEKCWSRPIPYNSGPILQHIHLQLLPQQELLHDYEHLGFWKVLRNNINQTVTSKKSPCMDPFLSVDTLYYFTFLCLSSCPEYLRTKIEKVHWPLSQLVCCCLCVVISGPLPSTCPTSSACLPEEIYKHRPHDEDCQSTCEHLRIRKQCILSKQSRSCKLECRILIM